MIVLARLPGLRYIAGAYDGIEIWGRLPGRPFSFVDQAGAFFAPPKVLQSSDNVLIWFKAKCASFAARPLYVLACLQPSKLNTRVRFPSPAPGYFPSIRRISG
jgi:hypothetical protein